MALTPLQIDDFVNLTLSLFKKHKWTDISLEHQEYVASGIITEKNVQERGGKDISFRIKHKNTGNSRNTGMFAQDITKVEDVTTTASVPWAMQTTNFSYDIYEDLFQSDRETIIKELKIREHDALSDMAELNEENLWSAPTSTTDTRPMGVPFWLQKNTSTPGGAFNGGNPSTHATGCASVSSVTFPRFSNWTFQYSAIASDDLIKKVKKSLAFTNFTPPVPTPSWATPVLLTPSTRPTECRNRWNVLRKLATTISVPTWRSTSTVWSLVVCRLSGFRIWNLTIPTIPCTGLTGNTSVRL